MQVEVLHIEECPNWEQAGDRVRHALGVTGHKDVEIRFRLLRTSVEAAQVSFAGSPTITVDGEDLFPSDGATTDLACRIYYTPAGLAGLPTAEQLVNAIKARWS